MKFRFLKSFLGGSIGLVIVSCTTTDTVEKSIVEISAGIPITVEKSTFSLCWAPPEKNADSVASYDVGYHTENSTNWIVLKSNIEAGSAPRTVINRSDLSSTDSIFFFAVRSVMKNGAKTDYHTSLDSTANPPDWYLKWK